MVINCMVNSAQVVNSYIDPASTSYLIQIGVGAVIAIGTVIGVYRNKIKRFFKSKFSKDEESTLPTAERSAAADREDITADDLLGGDK